MKVAIATTSRADWNAVGMVVARLAQEHRVDILALPASQMAAEHLRRAMHGDGLTPHVEKELGLTSDEGPNIGNAMGRAVSLASEVLWQVEPDLVFVSGDRWEMLAVALAAHLQLYPIMHLGAGDVTEGSLDNRMRHCISQLAQVRLATSYRAFQALGGDSLFVGSPALDRMKQVEFTALRWGPSPFVLVDWQPETTAEEPNRGLFEIAEALAKLPEVNPILIYPNPDPGYIECLERIRHIGGQKVGSLPPREYFTVMHRCACMVGNSSSGVIEAPFWGIPVVNVGDRQKGRHMARSVVSVPAESESILGAIKTQLTAERYQPSNQYGEGNACERIAEAVRRFDEGRRKA